MAYEEDDLPTTALVPDFLRDPLGIPRRRWPWMLAGAVVGLLITAWLVWSWEPRYRAWASITIDSGQLPEELIRSTVEETAWGNVSALQLEVLTRDRLASMIEELGLYPKERREMTLSELVYVMRGAVQLNQGWGFGSRRYAPSSQRNFSVSFEYSRPEPAAEVANRLADAFVEAGLRDRTQKAMITTDFLRRQLETAEVKLRQQEQEVKEYIERYRGELPSELNANLRKLDRLQTEKQAIELRIAAAEQQLDALLSGEADPNSPQSRLLMLRLDLQRILSIYTDEHPQVASVRRQIAAVEAEIKGEGGAVPEGLTPEAMVSSQRRKVALMRRQLAEVEAEIADLDRRVANTPTRQDELAVLNREAQVLREEYMDFLRKVQEAELSQTVESAQYAERISVTNRAKPPMEPVESRVRLLLLGLAGTLLAALGLGVVVEFFDPVLVSGDQLEGLSGVPVLGAVHHIA